MDKVCHSAESEGRSASSIRHLHPPSPQYTFSSPLLPRLLLLFSSTHPLATTIAHPARPTFSPRPPLTSACRRDDPSRSLQYPCRPFPTFWSSYHTHGTPHIHWPRAERTFRKTLSHSLAHTVLQPSVGGCANTATASFLLFCRRGIRVAHRLLLLPAARARARWRRSGTQSTSHCSSTYAGKSRQTT